jgi:hypothetical protein
MTRQPDPAEFIEAAADRPIFILRLRAQPGIDAVKALRSVLKGLLRHHGLVALSVQEERKS